jgi:hypothetical protein
VSLLQQLCAVYLLTPPEQNPWLKNPNAVSVMAGTALMILEMSLSCSKGPSLGLWCDCNFSYLKDSGKKLLCTAES